MNRAALESLARSGLVSELDIHFAMLMQELAREPSTALALAACLASQAIGNGHVCIDLAQTAGRALFERGEWVAPELTAWRAALRASGVVGAPGEITPLVLDGTRLYLHRYWSYERAVADALLVRASMPGPVIDPVRLEASLAMLFPGAEDRQKIAARMVATRALAIVSGGPGTGKTTTVIKALAALAEQSSRRIALAAPTGKAAARLQESLRRARAALPLPPEVDVRLPADASTVHRLLGMLPGRARFRHGPDNPLALDILIIDEASMLDLALIAKLIAALPARAQLVLLGDRDQLAAVEAGNVFADICAEGAGRKGPLSAAIAALQENYRFGAASGVGQFASAAGTGDARAALDILRRRTTDLTWQPAPNRREIVDAIVAEFAPLIDAAQCGLDPVSAFARLREVGVLCAHRGGPWGATMLNAAVEQALRARGSITSAERWYPGRPVIIAHNDYATRLFNGDLGIALPDPIDGVLRVFFEGAAGDMRALGPARVPACDTAYALTVHKAQGSEYERVIFVLPDTPSPVLTRELVYTAVTRAMRTVAVYGRAEVLEIAIGARVARASGLAERLGG
jgi:exodeoxyribonuclease V alpha subunit